MSPDHETTVEVAGAPYRVWTAGNGAPLGILAGFGGLLRWTPFLARLARHRTVIVPSLPGFPGGGGRAHVELDTQLDWLLRTRDLLAASGLSGADLAGVSLGAALAADVAAVWPDMVRRLVLVSPLGVNDGDTVIADHWGATHSEQLALLSSRPGVLEEHRQMPADADEIEWDVSQIRANEAAARLLWPNGETGLGGRIGRITCPTLVVWGAEDRMVPPGHRSLYRDGPGGPVSETVIEGAGHQADFDRPDDLAAALIAFLETEA